MACVAKGVICKEALQAACTKWNFLRFRAGPVGHCCIGVDPNCLTFKAEKLGDQDPASGLWAVPADFELAE